MYLKYEFIFHLFEPSVKKMAFYFYYEQVNMAHGKRVWKKKHKSAVSNPRIMTMHCQLVLSFPRSLHRRLAGCLALLMLDDLWCFLHYPVRFACLEASPGPGLRWLITSSYCIAVASGRDSLSCHVMGEAGILFLFYGVQTWEEPH